MPRQAKNPDHPLVRLRKKLSTDHHKFTREELSQKTGIPLPSLADIERGTYKLTPATAAQICVHIPVHIRSLLDENFPLIGWDGEPLTPKSPPLEKLNFEPGLMVWEALSKSGYCAALEEGKGSLLYWLFARWLIETTNLLGISEKVTTHLTNENLGLFDSSDIPEQFHPRGGGIARRWQSFFALVDEEEVRLEEQTQDQDPVAGEKFAKLPFNSAERKKRQWDSKRFHDEIRKQAIENVRKLWKEKDEEFKRSGKQKPPPSKRRQKAA